MRNVNVYCEHVYYKHIALKLLRLRKPLLYSAQQIMIHILLTRHLAIPMKLPPPKVISWIF
jgi:hypothetical protein